MPVPFRLLPPVSLLLCGLALALGASPARAENFPIPPSIAPRVDFWTRVYSEVGTNGGLIHDNEDLSLVYEVVRAPEGSSPGTVQRYANDAKERVRSALIALASGRRQGLSATERRVLAEFPPGVSSRTLRSAAERVRFQLGQADKFEAGLRRMGRWEGFIRRALRERGVPEDLVALPHVESSYNPEANSHAGAAGLWQFMRSTARLFMRVDYLVDERLDPYTASEGAARLLSGNYERLGSWPLAITAYNHGPGGMAKAVRTLGTRDIGTIVARHRSPSFGFASRNFYAEFMAARRIDRDPARYFGPIRKDAPVQPETVILAKSYGAGVLAKSLGLPVDALRDHNPALLGPIWSGSRSVPVSYALRVPRRPGRPPATTRVAGTAATLRFDETPRMVASVRAEEGAGRTGSPRAGTHRVQAGETLSEIAAHYGVNRDILRAANGIPQSAMIRVGQELVIPGRAEPEASGEIAAAPRSEPRADAGPAVVHRVAGGETLLEIGQRYGVSMAQIAARNDIRDPADLREGQSLSIPAKRGETAVVARAERGPGGVAPGSGDPEHPAAERPPAMLGAQPGAAPDPASPDPDPEPVAPAAPSSTRPAPVAGVTTTAPGASPAAPAATPGATPASPAAALAAAPAGTTRPMPAAAPDAPAPAPTAAPATAPGTAPLASGAPVAHATPGAGAAPEASAPGAPGAFPAAGGAAPAAEPPPLDIARAAPPSPAPPVRSAADAPVAARTVADPAPAAAESPPAPERVRIEPGDTLGAIAGRTGVDARALADANGIRDPRSLRPGQVLVIPRGEPGTAVASGPERTPEPASAPEPEPERVTIAPGDTLGKIAKRTGVDARALADANGIRDVRSLRPGQVLTIPREGSAAAAGAPASRAASAPRTVSAPAAAPEPRPAQEPERVKVASGDTLDAIAKRTGVSAQAIAAANGIRNPRSLRPGQVLEIPRADGRTASAAPATPPTYTVRAGDTLYSIAQRHGVTPAAIADLNGLRDHRKLSIGQRLRIPRSEEPPGRSG